MLGGSAGLISETKFIDEERHRRTLIARPHRPPRHVMIRRRPAGTADQNFHDVKIPTSLYCPLVVMLVPPMVTEPFASAPLTLVEPLTTFSFL